MDYRHEIKHVISPGDAMALHANLSAVAKLDPHAKKNGRYCIRSLYFDDPADTALHEKLDGVNERRKYRIRYYDGDLSYIMLECKMKRDGVGCKLQERLTLEETQRILNGDIAWMITSGRPLLGGAVCGNEGAPSAPQNGGRVLARALCVWAGACARDHRLEHPNGFAPRVFEPEGSDAAHPGQRDSSGGQMGRVSAQYHPQGGGAQKPHAHGIFQVCRLPRLSLTIENRRNGQDFQ